MKPVCALRSKPAQASRAPKGRRGQGCPSTRCTGPLPDCQVGHCREGQQRPPRLQFSFCAHGSHEVFWGCVGAASVWSAHT